MSYSAIAAAVGIAGMVSVCFAGGWMLRAAMTTRASDQAEQRIRDERDYWFRRATSAEAYIRNPHPLKHPVRYYDSLPYFLSSARPSPESE